MMKIGKLFVGVLSFLLAISLVSATGSIRLSDTTVDVGDTIKLNVGSGASIYEFFYVYDENNVKKSNTQVRGTSCTNHQCSGHFDFIIPNPGLGSYYVWVFDYGIQKSVRLHFTVKSGGGGGDCWTCGHYSPIDCGYLSDNCGGTIYCACNSGYTCVGNQCQSVASCTDESGCSSANANAKKCIEQQSVTCGNNYDNDACYEWGGGVDCSNLGQTCDSMSGECVNDDDCGECNSGDQRDVDHFSFNPCEENPIGCWKWGTSVDCPRYNVEQATCTPLNCIGLSKDCGEWPDGCNGVVLCGDDGSCSNSNKVCDNGVCECKRPTCTSESAKCGSKAVTDCDGNSITISCGTCPDGKVCNADNQCVCEDICDIYECGTWVNDCGEEENCGTCVGVGKVCNDGLCECG